MTENWGDMFALRLAGEGLNDAINARIRAENRFRSGSAGRPGLSRFEIDTAKANEEAFRLNIRGVFEREVPDRVRTWADSVPIFRGLLSCRIIALTGNPRLAVPMRMEGTGKDRKAVPDGDPYERGLRQFWQWCGTGDPDLQLEAGNQERLLKMGKRTTVKPLLYVFSKGIRMHQKDGAIQACRYIKVMNDAKADGLTHHHYKVCRNKHRPPLSSNGCGTSAHPEWGEIGSPWRPGHAEAHALRVTWKELLRDLWEIAG